jgi:chemotaxis response regulator CheB
MQRIRVLVTAMPALHADIIERIVREQPDMEIVGAAATIEDVGAVIDRAEPDVLLVTADAPGLVGAAVPMVLRHPRLTVIAVDAARSGLLIEARLSERTAGSWPAGLVSAIRHACGRPAGPRSGGEGAGAR